MNKIIQAILVLFFLWSCKAEKITTPAYVQIDDYYTKVTGGQGTNNQKFTDVLIFANGQSCGTFPIGKPIPVLTAGATTLLIKGVIEINGVSNVRADYELMQGCDTVITITQGTTTKIRPVFEYFLEDAFKWIENFDGDSIFNSSPLTLDSGSSISGAGIGFGGVHSKCLVLNPTENVKTAQVQKTSLNLPSGGVGVYMELNYQSNVNINVNITGASGKILGVGGVFPSAKWNKVYLDLTEQVSNLQEASYIITLYASYDASVNGNYAYIDNIKVISKQS